MGQVIELTDANFQSEVLQSDKPVLVDFWAPWCGPCRALAPIVEAVAREVGDAAKVAKLNIDENPQTTTAYNVSAIPTIVIFKGGQAVNRFMGLQDKNRLITALQEA